MDLQVQHQDKRRCTDIGQPEEKPKALCSGKGLLAVYVFSI